MTISLVHPASAQNDQVLSACFSEERILVKPLSGTDLTLLHYALGTTVLRSYPAIGDLQVVQLPLDATVTNIVAQFQQSGLVEYAQPDYILYALTTIPNDPLFATPLDPTKIDQWGMNNTGQDNGTAGADINAPEAWDIQTTAANIIVAVIDTGLWYTHEDLSLNLWTNPSETPGNINDDDGNGYVDDVHGINAILGTGNPADDHGHGTQVAGITGARGNNSLGVVGVAWQVQIMTCKFLTSGGTGFVSDAIECIDYARSNGAKIINASWGDYTYCDAITNPDAMDNGILDLSAGNWSALRDAVNSARAAGIIFVAACGNNGNDNDRNKLYPASFTDLDNVIAVAATDRNDKLASFSNFGATNVHLGAPGSEIISSYGWADDNYETFNGTSQATPHVAGACALVWAEYPSLTYQQVITRVLTAVDPVPSLAGKTRTGGRLNLYRALVPNGNGMWATTGSLNTGRRVHTATMLASGQVLVAGGWGSGSPSTAELYNPATGIWGPTTGPMTTTRTVHTAVLLPKGKVLVAGGFNGAGMPSAELYDPSTGLFTATGPMTTGRYGHTATLLPNGKVLVAGGAYLGYLASAELYDPANGTWAATTLPMITARAYHTATLLPNGKVLVVAGHGTSGYLSSAELYDPANGTWTASGPLTSSRDNHTATLLTSGKILVAGGLNDSGYLLSAELYDPATGAWATTTGPMTTTRAYHTATLLPNGKVLLAGGEGGSGALPSAELFAPATGTWVATDSLAIARTLHTATLLPNGKVLVAGGWGVSEYLSSAELYDAIRF